MEAMVAVLRASRLRLGQGYVSSEEAFEPQALDWMFGILEPIAMELGQATLPCSIGNNVVYVDWEILLWDVAATFDLGRRDIMVHAIHLESEDQVRATFWGDEASARSLSAFIAGLPS